MLAVRPQEPAAMRIHASAVEAAAEFLRGNERVLALQQAKAEFEASLPFTQHPDDARAYIARVEWLQTHCLVNAQTCKDNDGVPEISRKWWSILGALGIVAVGIFMVYRQHGAVGPRWPFALAAGPGLIYLVSIGLGGSLWATRKRKEREAREAAANAAKPLDDRPKPYGMPPVMRR